MTFIFNADSDVHIEIAEDILECLHAKSKWAMGAWTWVSLSNLQVYYDTKLVHTFTGQSYPEKYSLASFLKHLVYVGIVEQNQELFLRDLFFRLTKEGRAILEQKGDALYLFLLTQKHLSK